MLNQRGCTRTFRQKPDVVFSPVSDCEAALMHMGRGLPYALNEVGIFIWGLLERARSLDEIADAVVAEFDVDRADARRDADAFLDSLLDHDLVQAHG